jgi:hypothetical protein
MRRGSLALRWGSKRIESDLPRRSRAGARPLAGKAACARRAGDKLGIGAHSAPSENGARGSDLAHTGAPGLLEADRDSNMKRKQVTRAKVILIRARPPSPRSRNGGARAGRSTRSPEPSLGRARQVDLCGPPPPGSWLVPGCARPSGFGSQIRSVIKLSFRFALDHDGRPVPAKARSWSIDRHRTPTYRQADAHPGSNLCVELPRVCEHSPTRSMRSA